MLGFRYTSDWEYETSKDTTYSFIASYSAGVIVLRNVKTPEVRVNVQYRCFTLGESHGLPVGVNKSDFDTPSGGLLGRSQITSNELFEPDIFPCKGYIIGAGVAAGFGNDDDNIKPNAIGAQLILFGALPVRAGVAVWGKNEGMFPGVGIGVGLASFSLDGFKWF